MAASAIGSSPSWCRREQTPGATGWLFFGACAGQPELLHAYVDNLVRVLQGAREPILRLGEFEAKSFDECLAAIRRWGDRRDAAYWYAVTWAEGRRLGEP